MDQILLIAHVVAAILLLGPVAVATSMFPKLALAAHNGETGTIGGARTMHAICRTYGFFSLLVPLLGIGFMFTDLSLYGTNGIIHTSILLAVIAWALLFFVIVPRQRVMLAGLGVADEDESAKDTAFKKRQEQAASLDWKKAKGQLAMFSGIFNALWLAIAVLMFFI